MESDGEKGNRQFDIYSRVRYSLILQLIQIHSSKSLLFIVYVEIGGAQIGANAALVHATNQFMNAAHCLTQTTNKMINATVNPSNPFIAVLEARQVRALK